EPDDSDLDDVGDKNYMFWNRREVIAILQAAEKMFRERMLDEVLKAQIGEACTCEAQADGSTSDAPAPRKKKKSKKKLSVTLSTNVTSTGKLPQPTLMKNGADPLPPRSRVEVINLDEEDKASKLTAALEGLMLKIEGSGEATSTAQQPEKPQETPKSPQKASSSKAKSKPEQMPAPAKEVQVADKKSSAKAAPAALKTAQRKCAKCGKSEDVKLKKCALCVQQKMDPVYYCSRECQTEDWDEHQTVHMEDLN
ncbi:hypothetical protein MRX96_023577, partial [Rhipicephalus microplus]